MKHTIIIITVLISTLAVKAQVSTSAQEITNALPKTGSLKIELADNGKVKKIEWSDDGSLSLDTPRTFQPYYSREGYWIKDAAAAKKDIVISRKIKSKFSKADKEYIRHLVTTAYYLGLNRDASIQNVDNFKQKKLQQDLKKLNTAIDKSF